MSMSPLRTRCGREWKVRRSVHLTIVMSGVGRGRETCERGNLCTVSASSDHRHRQVDIPVRTSTRTIQAHRPRLLVSWNACGLSAYLGPCLACGSCEYSSPWCADGVAWPAAVNEANYDDDEAEFELRKVRKVPGAHRPASKGTPGWERDLLQQDGTNATLGPSESQPADDVWEELERLRRFKASAAAASTVGQPNGSDHLSSPHIPDLEDLPFAAARGPRLAGWALKAIGDFLATPEGREVVAVLLKTVWRKGGDLLSRKRGRQLGEALIADAALDEGADPTPDSAPDMEIEPVDEQPAVRMTEEQFREHLFALLAHEEAAGLLRRLLGSVVVEDCSFPLEVDGAVQKAMRGGLSQLSARERDVVMEFLITGSRGLGTGGLANEGDPSPLASHRNTDA